MNWKIKIFILIPYIILLFLMITIHNHLKITEQNVNNIKTLAESVYEFGEIVENQIIEPKSECPDTFIVVIPKPPYPYIIRIDSSVGKITYYTVKYPPKAKRICKTEYWR